MEGIIAAHYHLTAEEVELVLCSVDDGGELQIIVIFRNSNTLHLPCLILLQDEHYQLVASVGRVLKQLYC